MSVSVACVGDLTLDWLLVGGTTTGPQAGGSALYAAIGVWLTGGSPRIVARVGEDYPATLLEAIAARGLCIRDVEHVAGNSHHMLLEDRPNRRVVCYLPDSGLTAALDPGPDDLRSHDEDGVHLCLTHFAADRALLEYCRAHSRFSTLDFLFVSGHEPTQTDVLTLAPLADVFLPSWAELHQLWPRMGPRATLRQLTARGCRCAVIKMGSRGSVATDGHRTVQMPSLTAHVVDTTGAGNAFCGAFHATWRQSSDLVLALAWGAAAASVVIEGYGGLHALTEGSLERAAQRSKIGLETYRALA